METNNMNIRERFEEIWPVPECVEWSDRYKQYVCPEGPYSCCASEEYTAHLDTFTRCQETMAPVMLIIEELVNDLEEAYEEYTDVHGDMAITKAKAWLRSSK